MKILFATDNFYPHISGPSIFVERFALETNTQILPIALKSSYAPFNSEINIGKLIYFKNKKGIKKQTIDLMRQVYRLRNN